MFSLCLPKKIQAIFKKDTHCLEGWVLVPRFSEKASLIQELLPEIGIRNSYISLYTVHVSVWNCISVLAADVTLGASSNRVYFSNITRSPEVAGPGKCDGSSASPVPASLGLSSCFLPQVTRRWPTSSPPSGQKEKGRGRRWHQPTPEKQNLSPKSPAKFYYLTGETGTLSGWVHYQQGGRGRMAIGKASGRVHCSASLVICLYPEWRAILRLQWDRASSPRLWEYQRHLLPERENFELSS